MNLVAVANIVAGKGAAILKLAAFEDQALPLHGNACQWQGGTANECCTHEQVQVACVMHKEGN